jgi:replicative DNA helicase
MRTVVDQLRKSGTLEIVTAYYVAEITSKVSSSANIEYHSRVLIEQAMRREMIMMAGKILHEAYSDVNDVFDLLDFANEELKIVNSWVKQ